MEVITEIQKNQKEKIIVSTNEYKGFKYVDLRIHFLDESKDKYIPSKKGIALSPKVIPDILTAIQDGFERIDNPIPE
jgi:hypothetical protein|tara:strand:+ start:305 stop:535 length:231 start_codon:yes stop_codon:yes gene_type:complete